MSRILHISDERYEAIEALARERGQTPEEFINSLLDEAWEQACAKYDAAFEQDALWLEGAREALAQLEAGNSTVYPSTEAFFAHLGAIPHY